MCKKPFVCILLLMCAAALFMSGCGRKDARQEVHYELVDGKIVETGDRSLVDEINEHGFEKYLKACRSIASS